jgi:hypothetical protein
MDPFHRKIDSVFFKKSRAWICALVTFARDFPTKNSKFRVVFKTRIGG